MNKEKIVFLLGAVVDPEWAACWEEKCEPQEIADLATDAAKCGDEVQSKALEVILGLVRAVGDQRVAEERADVELTIQIGAETDAEVRSIFGHEAARVVRKLLKAPMLPPVAEIVEEGQWCAGAMRVTLRRQEPSSG